MTVAAWRAIGGGGLTDTERSQLTQASSNAAAAGALAATAIARPEIVDIPEGPPVTPVSGQFLRYAYRSYDGLDVLDEWPLATGAVCDAWRRDSMFDPGKVLPRPALGNEIQLGA